MSEDERQEMLRTVAEAHSGLRELAFKLRRELTAESPGAQGGDPGRGGGVWAEA